MHLVPNWMSSGEVKLTMYHFPNQFLLWVRTKDNPHICKKLKLQELETFSNTHLRPQISICSSFQLDLLKHTILANITIAVALITENVYVERPDLNALNQLRNDLGLIM